MRKLILIVCLLLSFAFPLAAQNKRIWVLRAPGEAVEYDPATFAEKLAVKIPPEALASPQNFQINALGQMLFAPAVALPLTEGDFAGAKKIWFWSGHTATTLTRDISRSTATVGSNLAITESAPAPFLSADGAHLFWFSNQARRLQRDGVDLSNRLSWTSWRTDLAAANREEIASITLPDCSCKTGACEESCPYEEVWIPSEGVGKFFLLTQFVAGQTQAIYKSTSAYIEDAGKWAARPLDPPLRRVLDAANADVILEAIPDSGCCGWSNESDDQTVLRLQGKKITVFDELAAYKNPDYDVSFYTQNGQLAPDLGSVALTINATSKPNTPIQLAEQGQANPEESQRIRKALPELPAVEVKILGVKNGEGAPNRLAFLPHATLVGWINDKEILIAENHMLVVYNVANGSRRKSTITVEDYQHVFLR
ncbi:MAG: hypothetical protein WA474_14660 [Candidatus Sulfotelmatobacter sp.]